MITNTQIANILDEALLTLKDKDLCHSLPKVNIWSEYLCVHVDKLEILGLIDQNARIAAHDAISESINNCGTFTGYFMSIHGEDAAQDHERVMAARIEHFTALANRFRNGEL